MGMVWKFQKAVKLYLDEETKLRVLFEDGKTFLYDVSVIFNKFPEYKCLTNRDLFLKGKLLGWGGVGWSSKIDLSVDTVYYDGIEVESEVNAIQYIIGFKIKQARLEKELSQKQLAELTGLDQSEISKLEKGLYNPSINFIQKLLKALNKTIDIKFVNMKKEAN